MINPKLPHINKQGLVNAGSIITQHRKAPCWRFPLLRSRDLFEGGPELLRLPHFACVSAKEKKPHETMMAANDALQGKQCLDPS